MRPNLSFCMLLVLGACLVKATVLGQLPAKDETLTNMDVISMVGSGLSTGIVKATIGRSKTNFDLSPGGLIQLKKSGMPDDILLAMLSKNSATTIALPKDTMQSLPSGIYYRSGENYKAIATGNLISEPSKGVGGALKKTFGGLVNFTIKANISGQHAGLNISESKPFYLFIPDFPARSPEEFFLVRLTQTPASRQITFQRAASASGVIVISDTLKIDFTSKKIQNGFYEVCPNHPLLPGDYCFMYNVSSLYQGTRFKIYDFTVQPKP